MSLCHLPRKTLFATEPVRETHACYPPVAETTEILGYVRDKNGIGYSRDIGRSSVFGGRCHYVFGDTFCKDAQGEFVGISSNTAAVVEDPSNPLDTEYLQIQADGRVNTFIPLTEGERGLEEFGMRVVLWAFGGIVEVSPGIGWVWYQKNVLDASQHERYYGVGVARISIGGPRGELAAFRCPGLIFEADEPRVGTFSSLIEGHHIYLWGDHNGGIILARVPRQAPTTRNAYKFWNGQSYVDDWREATHVLRSMQHGSFFNSPLFGRERPWVFVGCTSFGDSMVMVGAERSLEGPWALNPLLSAPGIDIPDRYRYCMYGHGWALDATRGELLVTWSEHWPGGVIGAKINFSMGEFVSAAVAEETSGCECSLM